MILRQIYFELHKPSNWWFFTWLRHHRTPTSTHQPRHQINIQVCNILFNDHSTLCDWRTRVNNNTIWNYLYEILIQNQYIAKPIYPNFLAYLNNNPCKLMFLISYRPVSVLNVYLLSMLWLCQYYYFSDH